MKYRVFGKLGWKVSEIGFGAWAIGGNRYGNSYGPTDDDVSRKAIQRALELGCNFFDTADIYGHGHSEKLLGEVIGNRPDVFIATKVGGDFYHTPVKMNFDSDYIRFACDQSLKRLQREVIDLYQLHNPPIDYLQEGKVFDVLDSLQMKGKIRAYGVSIHFAEEGLAAISYPTLASIQVVYNIFRQKDAAALFQPAKEKGIAIIAREPLSNGLLTGKYSTPDTWKFFKGDIRGDMPANYLRTHTRAAEKLRFLGVPGKRTLAQAALQFTLSSEAISVSIPGCKTPAQVEENLSASDCPPLTEEELEKILTSLSTS